MIGGVLCISVTLPVVVLTILVFISTSDASSRYVQNGPDKQLHLWTRKALEYVQQMECSDVCFSEPKQCEEIKAQRLSAMNVYSAHASEERKLIAQLPDAQLIGEHDGIVAIDPNPEAPFGHPVILFVVDQMDRAGCDYLDGSFIEERGECVRIAKKQGCHNVKKRKTPYSHSRRNRSCHIDFLPSVYEMNTTNDALSASVDVNPSTQLLQCREMAGFLHCPQLRPENASIWQCDSAACHHNLGKRLRGRCRLFEVCDQAVILHGGWNRLVSRPGQLRLVRDTRDWLLRYGFPSENIKTFFANGVGEAEGPAIPQSFPAYKTLFRQYIEDTCRQQYCVDSLVIVVQGSALVNGDLLLWDRNNDATVSEESSFLGVKEELQADREERYTREELLGDLAGCMAKQVHLIVDHSYGSTILARRIRQPQQYANVNIYTTDGSKDKDGKFSRSWMAADHLTYCMDDILQDMVMSQPTRIFVGDPTTRRNLFGGQCQKESSGSWEFDQGCRNVPTLLWFNQGIAAHAVRPQSFENSVQYQRHRPQSETMQRKHRFRHRRRHLKENQT